MNNKNIHDLLNALLKSNWPKCNELASEIALLNNQEAKNALIEALNKGERHHIRTASIKALKTYNDTDVIVELKKRLDDSAYEPRIEAKLALKELTGEDFPTSRGE
jgi:hypothetical protein